MENNFDYYNINSEQLNIEFKCKNIESFIRTDHMNNKERNDILKLWIKYADIFHIRVDQDTLSFRNQVKYQIKTHHEIPVYSQNRY